MVEGKAVPLQAWSGPEGSRKLRFPYLKTTAQDGGKVLALRTGRPYPQEILLLLLTLQPWVGLGLFNNSIPFLSVLYLRPPTNNFHPL